MLMCFDFASSFTLNLTITAILSEYFYLHNLDK